MKEFAPSVSKLFPYRVDPFQKGTKTILTVISLESISFPLKNIVHKLQKQSGPYMPKTDNPAIIKAYYFNKPHLFRKKLPFIVYI